MSYIEDLIADLCPDGVPHRGLKEVAGYSDTRIDADQLDASNFVGVDNLLSDKAGRKDATYLPNTARLTEFQTGDILLGNIRPYLKKVWLADRTGGCSGDVLAIRLMGEWRSSIVPKFLYFLLSSDSFFAYNMQHAKGAKMPRGNKQAILDFRIPVPPLGVQREIVRILDQFTRLQVELEAELEGRRIQYEHYLESLFGAVKGGQVRSLGDLGKFVRGNGLQKKDLLDSGTAAIHYGQIHTFYGTWTTHTKSFVSPDRAEKFRQAKPGDLVIATTSEDDDAVCKAVAWLGDTKAVVSGDAYIYSHCMNPKYVAYYFQTQLFQNQKKRSITGAKVRRVSGEALSKISIPVPSNGEQERIVSVLDKLDALVNDVIIGLPAELSTRRKQYEYYRDRLLTFKEAAA